MIVVGETGQFRWVARDADDGSWGNFIYLVSLDQSS